MGRLRLVVVFLFLSGAGLVRAEPRPSCAAGAVPSFSVLPMIVQAGRADRSQAFFCLANLSAAQLQVYSGADSSGHPGWTIPAREGGFFLATRKFGNYHWLQAREETPEGVISAATVHYFANPGPAPTAMLASPKAELEIVPQPLPREHWHYRAGETWNFLVRFKGRPLPYILARLETSGGTQQVFGADEGGVVRVSFPEDVRSQQDEMHGRHGHGGPGGNRFVLAVGYTDPEGRYYLSTFSYRYSAPASEGRSWLAGLVFSILGGLMGLPLVIHRRTGGTTHG